MHIAIFKLECNLRKYRENLNFDSLTQYVISFAVFSCIIELYVIESNPVGTSVYLDYYLASSLCTLGIYPFYPSFSIQHGSKRSLKRQSM